LNLSLLVNDLIINGMLHMSFIELKIRVYALDRIRQRLSQSTIVATDAEILSVVKK